MEMVQISKEEYELFKAQKALLEQQKKQIETLQERITHLEELFVLAQKRQYGKRSEKGPMDGQVCIEGIFNEAEASAEASLPEPTLEEIVEVKAHQRKKTSLKSSLPEDLEIEEIHHQLEGEACTCSKCHSPLVEIGTDVQEKLKIIPARYILQRHISHHYACRNCDEQGETVEIKKAPFPASVIPKSIATAESIAYVMNEKFVMGSPLYRLEQNFARKGIHLSRQTMSNWFLRVCEDYLAPICEEMKEELKRRDILHADETKVQVLREDGKPAESQSRMWVYLSGKETGDPIILYDYEPDWKQERPQEYLHGYQGYLITDSYAGYHSLPEGIVNVGCWAHARRKFVDARDAGKKTKDNTSIANKAIQDIGQLYLIEKLIQDKPPDERKKIREEKARPRLEAFFAWLETPDILKKGQTGKAIQYALNQRRYLENYLLDGRLEIDNNRAERAIKPFVIGRKNFLFCNTPKGARGSAIAYSLVETAKATGVDPYEYLVWALKQGAELYNNGQFEEIAHLSPATFRDQKNDATPNK